MKLYKKQNGITFIELVIIILILAIILLVGLARFGNAFESYDAQNLRAAANNINIGVSEALNRNITLADIRTTRLNDLISVSVQGLSDDIQMTNGGTGTIIINKITGGSVDKSATVFVDTNGKINITAITGFSNYHVSNGDIVAN